MFHDELLPNISIRIYSGDKEELLLMDLEINQQGQINLDHLVSVVKQTLMLESNVMVFVLNHSRGTYQFVHPQQNGNLHFTSLISESKNLVRQILLLLKQNMDPLISCWLILSKKMRKRGAKDIGRELWRRLLSWYRSGGTFIVKGV